MTRLADELDAFKAQFLARFPAEKAAVMARADAALTASFDAARVPRAGDLAPSFALPDPSGRIVASAELLRAGPLVVSFYRGGWCPYCNLELRAWQRALPELRSLGAGLVAISPQDPDHSLGTAERNDLAYPVLSDRGSSVAAAYGVAFTLPGELRALYRELDHALPAVNGTDDWQLPVPATFLLDRDGRVLRADVDLDYRRRLEPDEAILALRELSTTRAA